MSRGDRDPSQAQDDGRGKGRDDRWGRGHHRLLPAAVEAEAAYLGAAFLAPEMVLSEAPCPVEAFVSPGHALIAEQMLLMHRERRPIDLVTVTNGLRDRNLLEQAGGPGFVTAVATEMITTGMARDHAAILLEKLALRRVIAHCATMTHRAFEEQDAVKDIVEELVSGAVEIAASGATVETTRHVGEFASAALGEIEYAYDNRGRTVGIPSGFPDWDRMTGGWQKGFTYYFGARPAMGKSSLGLNFASNAAAHTLEKGCPVLFFSVEMTGVQLTKRLIFTLAQLNQQRARDGFLAEADFGRLSKACNDVVQSRLWIDETAALTIADFRARARRFVKKMRRERGVRQDGKPDCMIWIDYLQRMKGSSKRSEDARYLELQEIAQGISMTAKELDVPIGVLAQLKRPKDKKPDTEPDMTEFRECGDIEQEAHVVALIHRPSYYNKGNEEKQQAAAEALSEKMGRPISVDEYRRYAKLIIDKQREGPVGPIELRFIADYTKFDTWDESRRLYSNREEERQQTGGGDE